MTVSSKISRLNALRLATQNPFLILLLFFPQLIFCQNLLIVPQTPDSLFVCGDDDFQFSLQNNTAGTLAGLSVTLDLPSGLAYAPGSIVGATELNTNDLEAPVFQVADLPGNAGAAISLSLHATCELVADINAGQEFSIGIQADYAGGSNAVTTPTFKIETGLLIILGVTNSAPGAERDSMVTRSITIKNTRRGKIGALRFTDDHEGGYGATVAGAATLTGTLTHVEATFGGSFFQNFGDGDVWLEENESATLVEEITVTDCGTPSFFNTSNLRVFWGCDNTFCQYDSTLTGIDILPFSRNPYLQFEPSYAAPVNICGQQPAMQRMKIVNSGRGDATNVALNFSLDQSHLRGMDAHSFRVEHNGTVTPIAPDLTIPTTLQECGLSFAANAALTVPLVPALDSVDLLFDIYSCFESCKDASDSIYFTAFYLKICPETSFNNLDFWYPIEPEGLRASTDLLYDVRTCLVEGQSYDVKYQVESERLLTDTGVLYVALELPWGIFWDENCAPPLLDGKSPLAFDIDTASGVSTSVHLFFDLPMSSDSLTMPLCIKYLCQNPMACAFFPIGDGSSFTVFLSDIPCGPEPGFECQLMVSSVAGFTDAPSTPPACIPTVCRTRDMIVWSDCFMPDGDGNSSPGTSFPGCSKWDFQTYRTNYGFRDNDDDRRADDLSKADTTLARTDRYIPGDTMRVDFQALLTCGDSIFSFPVRVYHEVVQSDAGKFGADLFNARGIRNYLTDRDSVRYLGGTVRIRQGSTGQVFDCAAPDFNFTLERLFGKIETMNVSPTELRDELVTQVRGFNLNLQDFIQDGCLPPDFPGLQAGDSLQFLGDFQVCVNYPRRPAGSLNPFLINWRTNICDTCSHYAYNKGRFRRSQYSGFVDTIGDNIFAIRPCENSTLVRPFQFGIRLARPNLFPFELRPIAALLDYRLRKSPLVTPLSASVSSLSLQDNVPVFSNLDLPIAFTDTLLTVDYGPAFASPLDEGFLMKSGVVFGPGCNFQKPDSLRNWLSFWHPDCFFPENPRKVFREKTVGFNANAPILKFNPADTILYIAADSAVMAFTVANTVVSPALNAWLYLLPGSADQSDFEVVKMPAATPVPVNANGIFQLGQINGFGTGVFQVRFKNEGCDNTTLRFVYGWGCSPLSTPNEPGCNRDTFTLQLRPETPELELSVLSEPVTVPLCDSSDYFVFEIFNANRGFAYEPIASVRLPQGLSIQPNSCQIEHPAGSGFVPASDPEILPNNTYRFKINDLSPTIEADGLPGVNLAPANAIRLRFRVLTACDAVSGAAALYGCEALQVCGDPANSLLKPGGPISIEGLNPQYGVQITLTDLGGGAPVPCGQEREFGVQLQTDGTPAPGDSIAILLPPGLSVVSYIAGANAPSGSPQINGQTMLLTLPEGLPAGSVVQFRIRLRYDSPGDCADKLIRAQTRARKTAFCPAINADCGVYVVTGEAALPFVGQNPTLEIISLTPSLAADGTVQILAQVQNTSTLPAPQVSLQYFLDLNGNRLADPGEPQVGTAFINQILAPNNIVSSSSPLPGIAFPDICQLIAVLPGDENCACSDHAFTASELTVTQPPQTACLLDPVTLGLDPQPGHSYSWTPAQGLSCSDCAMPTLLPNPATPPGLAQVFTLQDQAGSCVIRHTFSVVFVEKPAILTPDATICQGDSVQLVATSGATVLWSGPGLSNVSGEKIWVKPDQTATFTADLALGSCDNDGSVTVTVRPSDKVVLPKITTCAGVPVTIFGNSASTAGTYTGHFANQFGCDSVVTVELVVLSTQTDETRLLCAGDTLIVFDTVATTAGIFCKTFKNALGCDSTHCVEFTVAPKPSPERPDTIFMEKGKGVVLPGPGGFAQYLWEPADSLSCADCQNPTANPAQSTTYTLTVTDAAGCTASVVYRVVVLPPCDPNRIALPNAVTPNGDGTNDSFRLPKIEGVEETLSLEIYNRWGAKVFAATGPNAAWNATIDDKPAPMDVYVFIIYVGCPNGGSERRVGDVTVLR